MPILDPADLSSYDRYRLVIDSVVPRPIAWITSRSDDGALNLAPFSFFMGVSSSPPTVAVSIGTREPKKDTLANLESNGEAVVHLVPAAALETVNQTGGEYAQEVSEIDALKLNSLPSEKVAPPRLAAADVALECRLYSSQPIGDPAKVTLCILEIILVHVAEAVAQSDAPHLPDPAKLSAVARLGERYYLRAENWELSELPSPSVPEDLALKKKK